MSTLGKLFPQATARPWHQNDRMQAALAEVAQEIFGARTDREFSEAMRAFFCNVGLPEDVGPAAFVHAVNHFDALVSLLARLGELDDVPAIMRDEINATLKAAREAVA